MVQDMELSTSPPLPEADRGLSPRPYTLFGRHRDHFRVTSGDSIDKTSRPKLVEESVVTGLDWGPVGFGPSVSVAWPPCCGHR
jgi:hypothetical protein